jgi:tryptophan 2,3-dioxygenase
MAAATTYASYLRIDGLLSLQDRLTGAHDELQFIVVHQVFELWFKLLVFELESLRDAMQHADVPKAIHLLRRIHEIVKTLTAGLDVIETMRPYDFLEFRSELQPASGFQSRQFREIEIISGCGDPLHLRAHQSSPDDHAILQRRMGEPTLWEAFLEVLAAHGLPIGSDGDALHSLIRIQKEAAFSDLNDLVEDLIEYDVLFSVWRRRHVLMVERMIGARPGTGEQLVAGSMGERYGAMGTGGVDYLATTLGKRFFPLMWEARTYIER